MSTYAKILDYVVVDIVTTSDPNYNFDSAYTWINVTDFTIQPLAGWSWGAGTTNFYPPNDGYGQPVGIAKDATYVYYTSGNVTYTFPLATSQDAAYLSMAKQANIARIATLAQDYIATYYSTTIRQNFIVLYLSSIYYSQYNRQSYIEQFFPWIRDILNYSAQYAATVNAMTDIATVVATEPDFSTLNTRPTLTLLGALNTVETMTGINIGNAATGSSVINIGTDYKSKTITMGNPTGTSSITLLSGSGGITLKSPSTVYVEATGSGGGVQLNSGSGGFQIDSSGQINFSTTSTCNFNSAGLVGINNNQAGDVSLGTSSDARTITIGNNTSTTQLIMRSGTRGFIYNTPSHTALSDADVTVTIAQLLTGLLLMTPLTLSKTITMPTAANAVDGVPGVAVGDCIDFKIINDGVVGIDVTVNTGGTLHGYATTLLNTSTSWRLRFTNVTSSSEAYSLYRICG